MDNCLTAKDIAEIMIGIMGIVGLFLGLGTANDYINNKKSEVSLNKHIVILENIFLFIQCGSALSQAKESNDTTQKEIEQLEAQYMALQNKLSILLFAYGDSTSMQLFNKLFSINEHNNSSNSGEGSLNMLIIIHFLAIYIRYKSTNEYSKLYNMKLTYTKFDEKKDYIKSYVASLVNEFGLSTNFKSIADF